LHGKHSTFAPSSVITEGGAVPFIGRQAALAAASSA
jgi:hypothetical protein